MNKPFFAVVFVLFGFTAFAQQLTVAVSPFDIRSGFTKDESEVIFELFVSELVGAGTLNVVDRNSFDKIMEQQNFQLTDWSDSNKVAQLGKALNANSIIRCVLMKMGEQLIMTANILDVNTAQILSSSNVRMKNVDEIFNQLPPFVKQLVAKLPKPPPPPIPNYFVGRWRCVENYSVEDTYIDRTLSANPTCILNIGADGTIIVEQYDTLQVLTEGKGRYKGRNEYSATLTKYTGRGTGRYTLQGERNGRLYMDFTLNITGASSMVPSQPSGYAYIDIKSPISFTINSGLRYCYVKSINKDGRTTANSVLNAGFYEFKKF